MTLTLTRIRGGPGANFYLSSPRRNMNIGRRAGLQF